MRGFVSQVMEVKQILQKKKEPCWTNSGWSRLGRGVKRFSQMIWHHAPVSLVGCEVADFQMVTKKIKAQDCLRWKWKCWRWPRWAKTCLPVHRVGKCKRFQGSRKVRDPPFSPTKRSLHKLSKWSGNCLDKMETIQIILKLSWSSRNCPGFEEGIWFYILPPNVVWETTS